jgi:hypothetical protein
VSERSPGVRLRDVTVRGTGTDVDAVLDAVRHALGDGVGAGVLSPGQLEQQVREAVRRLAGAPDGVDDADRWTCGRQREARQWVQQE